MKYLYTLLSTAAITGVTTSANAISSHLYANTMTTHNVATIQQTISQNAFLSFAGFMSTNTYARPQKYTPMPNENPYTTYGHAQVYGTTPLYGEFNDDGTYGRSGGDTLNTDAMLNGLWAKWHHTNEDVNFDNFDTVTSKSNMFSFGIAGGQSEFIGGLSKWGLFAGYLDAQQLSHDYTIDETGGFFGLYNGNKFGKFGLYVTLTGGILSNTVDTTFGSDEYTNMWAGAMLNTTYDIAMDSTFTIQPGLQTGYTWVETDNYTTASGDILQNKSTGIFQIAPTVRAIKHIGNKWYASANIQHVMFFTNGGDITANDVKLNQLDIDGYTEYSLSLEKNISNFNLSATFGRRDGAHNGWIGGVNIKYNF